MLVDGLVHMGSTGMDRASRILGDYSGRYSHTSCLISPDKNISGSKIVMTSFRYE